MKCGVLRSQRMGPPCSGSESRGSRRRVFYFVGVRKWIGNFYSSPSGAYRRFGDETSSVGVSSCSEGISWFSCLVSYGFLQPFCFRGS